MYTYLRVGVSAGPEDVRGYRVRLHGETTVYDNIIQ